MSAESDVSKAFVSRWNASAAVVDAVPGGISADRVATSVDKPVQRPYAEFSVKQGPRPNDHTTNGSAAEFQNEWIDYQALTIKIHGVGKDAVGDVVSTVRAMMEAKLPAWSVENTVGFMRLENLPGEANEIDPANKEGEDYRVATIPYCVWTHRKVG